MVEHPTQDNFYVGGDVAVMNAFKTLVDTEYDMKQFLSFYSLFERSKNPDFKFTAMILINNLIMQDELEFQRNLE